MTRIRTLISGLVLVSAGALSTACGGASKHDPKDDCADGSCEPSCQQTDSCNPSCMETSTCNISCVYQGMSYASGATFPSSDGCNTCSCSSSGEVACTKKACISCESISTEYGVLIEHAKTCDPQAPNQCTLRVFEGLGCGCGTFVNPANWDEAAIAAASTSYQAGQCGGNVQCGECNVAVTAACSAQGQCITNSDPTEGAACRVGDTTYPNGSIGISDPTSCNSCTCDRGKLACTEKSCPMPCPAGMAPGHSCAQCGPVDNCEVVETGCFPTCTDTCAEGACIQGLCLSACG
jgi:hypothetical protein